MPNADQKTVSTYAQVAARELLLDQHLISYFVRDPYILPSINRMQDGGIITIRDLIQKSSREVFSTYRLRPVNRRKIIDFISSFGLDFAPDGPNC